MSDSYLYIDLLALKGNRKPDLLEKLLQALALQIGNELFYNELSKLLQVDKNTVARYIDLLEKNICHIFDFFIQQKHEEGDQ